jgi:hypothetical protein
MKIFLQVLLRLPILIGLPGIFLNAVRRWVVGTYRFHYQNAPGRPPTPWEDAKHAHITYWLHVWRGLAAARLYPEDMPLLPRPMRPKVRREPEAMPLAWEWFSGCEHLAGEAAPGTVWWLYRVLEQDPRNAMPWRKAQWLVCCGKCLQASGGDVHMVHMGVTAQSTSDWTREGMELPLLSADVPPGQMPDGRKEDDHV